MTDSDSSTDPEDFEYIPEGEVCNSDSEASVGGEEEEKRGVARSSGGSRNKEKRPKRQRKGKSSPANTRKRRGGIKLGEEEQNDESDSGDGVSGERGDKEEEEEKKQIQEKTRVDDLWASFKQDVGPKVTTSGDSIPTSVSSKKEVPKMVKIKKTYDFAGDEVVVEEEVAADSKEAWQFMQAPEAATPSHVSSTTSSSRAADAGRSTLVSPSPATSLISSSSSTASRPLLAGSKRSGLGSVLQSLSKKPKMSTLEKSKLDWNRFKEEEGLEHELLQQCKDGYLERQEFLQRADMRQFELEREERLKRYRRLH